MALRKEEKKVANERALLQRVEVISQELQEVGGGRFAMFQSSQHLTTNSVSFRVHRDGKRACNYSTQELGNVNIKKKSRQCQR